MCIESATRDIFSSKIKAHSSLDFSLVSGSPTCYETMPNVI